MLQEWQAVMSDHVLGGREGRGGLFCKGTELVFMPAIYQGADIPIKIWERRPWGGGGDYKTREIGRIIKIICMCLSKRLSGL